MFREVWGVTFLHRSFENELFGGSFSKLSVACDGSKACVWRSLAGSGHSACEFWPSSAAGCFALESWSLAQDICPAAGVDMIRFYGVLGMKLM